MLLPDKAEVFDLTTEDYTDIIRAYEFLINMFGNISGLEIKGSNDDLDINHENGIVTVESDGYFKLKGVSFEAGGSAGPIDICFEPDLTIIGVEHDGHRQPIIKISETAVAYLEVREFAEGEENSQGKVPAEVLSAFHYDFDMDPDSRHPIFHAQYEPSSIELGPLSNDYIIDNECHVTDSVPNHPRVPTAPLDFAGVLCMIIKEHHEDDNVWPSGVLRAVELLPKLPAWCFEPGPQNGVAMLPEWWYLHSEGANEIETNVLSSRSPNWS